MIRWWHHKFTIHAHYENSAPRILHHHHQAAGVSRAVLCHIVSLQYLSRSSLHRLAGLPCRIFLPYFFMVSKWWYAGSIDRLWCGWYACPGPFDFSHSVDYIYDFCPLPDPDVGLSIFVCDVDTVEHTSFHFGLCGRKFVLQVLYVIACMAAHRSCTPVSSGRWQGCFWRYPGV